jgi:hypothetical protein
VIFGDNGTTTVEDVGGRDGSDDEPVPRGMAGWRKERPATSSISPGLRHTPNEYADKQQEGTSMSQEESMSMGEPDDQSMSMGEPDQQSMSMGEPDHSMGEPDQQSMSMGEPDHSMGEPGQQSMSMGEPGQKAT